MATCYFPLISFEEGGNPANQHSTNFFYCSCKNVTIIIVVVTVTVDVTLGYTCTGVTPGSRNPRRFRGRSKAQLFIFNRLFFFLKTNISVVKK